VTDYYDIVEKVEDLFYFVEGGVVDVDEDLMDEIGAEGLVAVAAGQ